MEPKFVTGVDGTTDPHQTAEDSATGHGWLRGFTVQEALIGVAVLAVALTIVGATGWLVYHLVTGLFGLLGQGAGALGDAGHWLLHGPVTRTVTDPVRRFLHGTTTDPATGEQLWRTWLVVLLAVFTAAVLGSRGGRIGWTVLGLATTYMTFRGGGDTAAATTALVWALLSVPAFAGTTRPQATADNHPGGRRDAAASTDTGT